MTFDHKTRELIERSRRALRPSDADRQRIEAALRAQLGHEALTVPETVASLPRKLLWKLVSGAAVVACVVGFMAIVDRSQPPAATAPELAPRTTPEVAPTSALEARQAGEGTEPAEATDATTTPPVEVATPVLPRSQPRAAAARPSATGPKGDSLAREVALLSRATGALRAGDTSAALRSLDEHQQRFPRGVLREERRAARAQVLCSIGRVSEGKAELTGASRDSPTAARAQQLCAAAAAQDAARGDPQRR